jgi:osmotically-inducible protein OsmY
MKNDLQLKSEVEQELRWDPSLHAEQIGVSVRDGVVELTGHVFSFLEKWAAERAAMRVSAVKALASEIQVDMPESAARTDADIARAALHQIEWNLLIPNTVKVQVSNGSVKLTGSAEWQYQKEEAEHAIRLLRGVKWVDNEIQVTPRVDALAVRADIENALRRQAAGDAPSQILVETDGKKVTLRGYVCSWSDRDRARIAAWSTPGVLVVEDLIAIR